MMPCYIDRESSLYGDTWFCTLVEYRETCGIRRDQGGLDGMETPGLSRISPDYTG